MECHVRVTHRGPLTLLRPLLLDVTESVVILSTGNMTVPSVVETLCRHVP